MKTLLFDPDSSPIHWSAVSLEGSDAKDFLHRLSTVDVKTMKVGEGSPGFFLSAQGRIRAHFRLWRVKPDSFLLEFDGGKESHWKQNLLSAIDQFTFAEKMTLSEPLARLKCLWIFPPSSHPGRGVEWKGGIQLFYQSEASLGRPWITAWGESGILEAEIKKLFPGAEPLSFECLSEWRVQSKTPWEESEISEDVNPLEIGLSREVSEDKGCYPGQEVIERIRSMGAPPRKLVLLKGEGPPPAAGSRVFSASVSTQAAASVSSSASEIGLLTTVVATGVAKAGGFLGLALLRKSHVERNATVYFEAGSEQATVVDWVSTESR